MPRAGRRPVTTVRREPLTSVVSTPGPRRIRAPARFGGLSLGDGVAERPCPVRVMAAPRRHGSRPSRGTARLMRDEDRPRDTSVLMRSDRVVASTRGRPARRPWQERCPTANAPVGHDAVRGRPRPAARSVMAGPAPPPPPTPASPSGSRPCRPPTARRARTTGREKRGSPAPDLPAHECGGSHGLAPRPASVQPHHAGRPAPPGKRPHAILPAFSVEMSSDPVPLAK